MTNSQWSLISKTINQLHDSTAQRRLVGARIRRSYVHFFAFSGRESTPWSIFVLLFSKFQIEQDTIVYQLAKIMLRKWRDCDTSRQEQIDVNEPLTRQVVLQLRKLTLMALRFFFFGFFCGSSEFQHNFKKCSFLVFSFLCILFLVARLLRPLMTIAGCRQFSLITPPTASVNKSIVVDTTNRRWTSVCNKFVRTDYLLKLSNQDRLKSDLIQVVRSFYWRLNKRRPVQSAAINFSRLLLGFVSVIAFVCVFFIRWLIRSLDVITGGKKSDCATRTGPPFFFPPTKFGRITRALLAMPAKRGDTWRPKYVTEWRVECSSVQNCEFWGHVRDFPVDCDKSRPSRAPAWSWLLNNNNTAGLVPLISNVDRFRRPDFHETFKIWVTAH
jgi:hypothetical protein